MLYVASICTAFASGSERIVPLAFVEHLILSHRRRYSAAECGVRQLLIERAHPAPITVGGAQCDSESHRPGTSKRRDDLDVSERAVFIQDSLVLDHFGLHHPRASRLSRKSLCGAASKIGDDVALEEK